MAETQTHLYWTTGCTSCLRAKEFLERNEVPFVSHNVVEDRAILDEMEAQGLPRQVPIVKRGEDWADAQALDEVARIAGVDHEADPLPVDELYRRLDRVLTAALDYVDLVPEGELATDIPDRPRSIGELTYHLFSIPESFLEHEAGTPLRSYKPEEEWTNRSPEVLRAYGEYVRVRLHDYFEGSGAERDWDAPANVYYGDVSVNEFFERTTWHAGQHARQLEWVLAEEFGVDVDPIDPATWEGLPMPEKVWDARDSSH
ncbi:MAG: DinB family protein [Haloarculaceae archaeon]